MNLDPISITEATLAKYETLVSQLVHLLKGTANPIKPYGHNHGPATLVTVPDFNIYPEHIKLIKGLVGEDGDSWDLEGEIVEGGVKGPSGDFVRLVWVEDDYIEIYTLSGVGAVMVSCSAG